MGISVWDIYVTNLDSLNRLKKQSIFTIRVDNKKITNDNLNDYDINIYGGFRYSDSTGKDNYIIKMIGGYGISNNLNISVEQVINFVAEMPESKVYDIGDYWIGFSLSNNFLLAVERLIISLMPSLSASMSILSSLENSMVNSFI